MAAPPSHLTQPLQIVALLGSSNPRGHSAALASLALEAAARAGHVETLVTTPDHPASPGIIERADAIVIATPTYRESFPGSLKAFFDELPRGAFRNEDAPLAGKPVGIVMTGASSHHYLALNSLHGLLVGGYAALVVPVSIYGHNSQFDDDHRITDSALSERASLLGHTLHRITTLLAPHQSVLRTLRPQI